MATCHACRLSAANYTPETCPSQYAIIASEDAHRNRAYRSVRYAFVAVGTTSFDALIKGMDNAEYVHMLYDAGIRAIVLQRGASGQYDPWKWVNLTRRNPEKEPIKCYTYRTSDDYDADIRHADIIICHSGAGTLLNALKSGKRVITVPNPLLMDNHQQELANALAEHRYVLQASTGIELVAALSRILRNSEAIVPFPFWKSTGVPEQRSDPPLRTVLSQYMSKDAHNHFMLVLGSGGHTEELISMVEVVGKAFMKTVSNIHHVVASGDDTSLRRLDKSWLSTLDSVSISTIRRARHVGQSWFTSVFTFLLSLFGAISIIFAHRPTVILCNGPGTCLPICIVAAVCRLFGMRTRVIFVESFARVRTLSLTGRVIHALRLADEFLVMWPDLCKVYKRVRSERYLL